MKKRGASVLLTLALMGMSLPSLGVLAPKARVKNILEEVMAIQNDPALAGPAQEKRRAEGIRTIIRKNFDFPHMAQSTLGPAFQRLSQSQRQEFIEVFSSLFQASYTQLVLRFLKQETITYDRESLQGSQARVATTIKRANDAIPVEYLLHQKNGNWLLYDVVVDGVSILEQYRVGFARELQTGSIQTLLEKMRVQLKALL